MEYTNNDINNMSNSLPFGVKATKEITFKNFWRLPKFWGALGTAIVAGVTGDYFSVFTAFSSLGLF